MTDAENAWLKQLYFKHSALMFKIAAYRLGDEERARDLVQDIFLLLIARLDQVMTYDNPAGWLFEALNRSILAAAQQERRRSREVPLEEDLPAACGSPADAPRPLAEVLPAALREKDREILLLYFEAGLSHKEIALRLGISEGTCYTRLCRAKERCKVLLVQERQKNNWEQV